MLIGVRCTDTSHLRHFGPDKFLPVYYITKVFLYEETSIHQTELAEQYCYNLQYGDANANSLIEANSLRFSFLPNRLSTLMRNSLFYTYPPIIAISRNYRRITDASVDTNVVSSLLTAVAFLCFHI